jgi:hypothetical protein
MSVETRAVISVTTEVAVYPSSEVRDFLFSIPACVLRALDLDDRNLKGVHLYLVVRDASGHLIHHRRVELTSGPEVRKDDFESQVAAGQLYPGQRLRLEVSLP